jgi:hypothetical protein
MDASGSAMARQWIQRMSDVPPQTSCPVECAAMHHHTRLRPPTASGCVFSPNAELATSSPTCRSRHVLMQYSRGSDGRSRPDATRMSFACCPSSFLTRMRGVHRDSAAGPRAQPGDTLLVNRNGFCLALAITPALAQCFDVDGVACALARFWRLLSHCARNEQTPQCELHLPILYDSWQSGTMVRSDSEFYSA